MSTKISHDPSVTDRARQLAKIDMLADLFRELAGPDNVCFCADLRRALAELAVIAGRDADGPDDTSGEDQDGEDRAGEYDEEDWQPYCVTCDATVGIFIAHGDAYLHYTGQGTAAEPIDLYDAGHEPKVAWRPAVCAGAIPRT